MRDEVRAAMDSPAHLPNLGEYTWIARDDSARWVIAATSYAGRDLYHINLLKVINWKMDPKDNDDNLYMFLYMEKIALVRKEDIPTVSFAHGNLLWHDSDTKSIKLEKMCSEFQRYAKNVNGNPVCIECPSESGSLGFQQETCVTCKELESYVNRADIGGDDS